MRHSAQLATVISRSAHVSKHASLGIGTIVMHNTIVNADSQVGDNCILNTGCNIEHDTIVGAHTHISTHAVINGGCAIGNEVFIGSNSTVANHKTICDLVLLGAGSVVTKDIYLPGVYFGNPLQKID
ncbi:sugar O-acyltransferase (sialic acid O-acetyltransferase NeuD family) [Flavobacterium sp. W4I14]|nr:sugar O-acyltransferase (sialic acid O-acetyltransferase NeuD family) [Flavobacterium sp. W4I14]